MNLVTFLSLCLTILVQQTICQDSVYKKYSCENENIRKYIVDRHNELRAQVDPSPSNMLKMEWSDEAAANAQIWANKCEHCHSKADQREITTFGCGENLYMSSRLQNWTKVIQGWWDENKDFDYGSGPKQSSSVIGHYTQLVWYRSFKIGCALAYCPKQSFVYYYVCQYCPAGNVKKNLHCPYEAGEACSQCKHACNNGLCVNPCPYDDEFEECSDYKDLCDSEEEDMDEEYKIKNICKETCNCDSEIR
ncbi:cysteine-rich venom protein TEL1-like [Rhinoderma darwinii]|uniref:cysteine-rich venom protein TEL1-like n=1 Tax=Rhinoderma darwinii TaxID=43563 RepID=UPI003F681105